MSIMNMLILILFANQVRHIFGELIVLRGPLRDAKHEVLCISEDDGGALKWNTRIILNVHKPFSSEKSGILFPNACNFSNNEIDCEMNESYGCLTRWNREHWKFTHSASTHMGPVFDKRSEAFTVFKYEPLYRDIYRNSTGTIVVSFSVRTKRDVHILICNKEYTTGFCYWIIIGGWNNTKSVIRKCPTGVPSIGENLQKTSQCAIERAHLNHTAFYKNEWRTFVIMWNPAIRNISIYDPNRLIMTYKDTEEYDKMKFSNIFLRNDVYMLILYHNYSFLYTDTQDAVLRSPTFHLINNVTCLQLLIGLCAECDADIVLRDSVTNKTIHIVTVNGSSVTASHGLPMWQSVKIEKDSQIPNRNAMRLEVIPKLRVLNINPVWAIANIRECPPKGCFRVIAGSVVSETSVDERDAISKYGYYWQNITCQKLFYKEQSVVHPLWKAELNMELDDANCSFGYTGPKCLIQCKTNPDSKLDCKGIVICNKNGCTCPAGYIGHQCDQLCSKGFYSHSCKKCGKCFQDKPCHRETGACLGGCKNTANYTYIPPLCQIAIDTPNKLQIIFRNQTTIIANAEMKWKEEFKEQKIFYSFRIKALDGKFINRQIWIRILQNNAQLVAKFDHLLPATFYKIMCSLSIGQTIVNSTWLIVETSCDRIHDFRIMPNITNLTIDVGDNENKTLYSCPTNSYRLLIKQTDNQNSHTQMTNISITSFPYTISHLTPNTSYIVKVLHANDILFYDTIRTLKAECRNGFYGLDCRRKCGSCLHDKQCDRASGACSTGCKNTANYTYISPLCQTGFAAPNELQIVFKNQTTIIATVPVKWEEEYEKAEISYLFEIKILDGNSVDRQVWKRIFSNTTELIGTFKNLQHATIYQIMCSLFIEETVLNSVWVNVETTCDTIHDFRITPNITNLTIDMGNNENQTLYPCPTNSYRLLIEQRDDQYRYIQTMNTSITSFPYTLRLTPGTSYIVKVLHANKILFYEIIRKLGAECRNGIYGLDCTRKCGSCLHDKQCDHVSGACPTGCKNTANYTYISPLCQTGLGAPKELQIVFKNQTTVVASVPMKWEEEYEKADISYSFNIKILDGNSVDRQVWKKIFSNTTELIGTFKNLQHATIYQIMCSLSIGQTVLNGTWLNVETTCDTIHDFRITPNITNLTIDMGNNGNQTLYVCPANSYRLLFKQTDNENNHIQTMNTSITSFPYTLSRLTPHTSYIVLILHRNKILFYEIIRTLDVECRNGFYGLDCRSKCGSCLHDKQCDRASGACLIGCKNKANYIYISPLCQTGLGAPNELHIVFKNQTTVVASVPMKWEEEYEKADISYSFEIKTLDGISVDRQVWKRVFSNTTELIGKFENLQPATIYQIMGLLFIEEEVIRGTSMNVKTTCVPVKDFHITPNETSLTIDTENGENSLYSCSTNSYRLLFQQADSQNDQMINTSLTSFPYTLSHLTPYTCYNIVIFHENEKLFAGEFCTLEGVPSEVRNLVAISTSSSRVKLTWTSPQKPNGVITKYMIFLKIEEYFGCRDYKLHTTINHIITRTINTTLITISELHPYAKFDVQVVAHNSRYYSKSAKATFHTVATEVPAVTFSQLRMQDWILSWKPPENCTTILGPLKVTRVEIRGISDAVKNFYVIKNTSRNYLDMHELLYGAERYVVKIFALRDYGHQVNSSAYKEYEFETPSKAPPKVINLDVVEVDNNQMIHLRWQSPSLPTNGKLNNYFVRLCDKNTTDCVQIYVQLNETCDLWDNYICKTVQGTNNQQIYVVAYNKDVSQPSPFAFVTKEMLSNTKLDVPRNFTLTTRDHGIVDIQWLHPWRTGGHLQCFRIKVEEISSNLRNRVFPSSKIAIHEYSVINYMREYSKRLYLSPSTKYIISIQAVTMTNVSSNTTFLEVRTSSSIDLDGNLILVQAPRSTILMYTPKVLNDTFDSMSHIVIKGPNLCEQYTKLPKNLLVQADKNISGDHVWQVAKIPTNKLAGDVFTIDGPANFTNCPLKHGELYEIIFIITESDVSGERVVFTSGTSIHLD
ncbi:uncharacterized protein LOC116844537 [Odontomachus brunneus]|uniref:uncharacterized protein LOC116844537 n=1 Tax=Odontomachus brunneus TaxID=486640 RepID=UPI0013F25C82|nr:uncharacterized protein LOC116844537 [Odontomachus brunneus]XP_032672068.1 uncharacterized protein LOC116844537 [Odontomachus brunneus]